MTRREIADDIRAFLTKRFPNPAGGSLTDATPLVEEWFVDSLAVIEVALYLEKRFGLDLGGVDVNAENFATVDSLSDFIMRRLASGSGDSPR